MIRPRQDPVAVVAVEQRSWFAGDIGTAASDQRHGLYVVLDRRDVTVDPGGEVAITVRVRNTGSLVERALVEVRGLPQDWVVLEPAELNLDVGREANLVVRLRPPKAATAHCGNVPFTLVVWSVKNPRVRCVESCRLAIGAFDAVGVRSDPQSWIGRGRGPARFALTVENHGNRTLMVELVATVADGTATARCEPDHLELRPGGSAASTLVVRARRHHIVGGPIVHGVRVELRGAPGSIPTAVTLRQVGRMSRTVAKVLLVILLLMAVAGAVAARSAWTNRPRPVPEVTGLTREQAEEQVERAGFTPVVQERQDRATEGLVIAQNPLPGERLRPTSDVTVVVSTGPPPIEVPQVQGFTGDEAKRLLESQAFVVSYTLRPDAAVPAGAVIEQVPSAGAQVDLGSTVELTVSSGPPPS